MVVLRMRTMHAQDTHALVQERILREAHPSITEGPKILGRKERQATDIATAPGTHAVGILRADGLRRILDEFEPVALGDGTQLSHVRALTVEMNRHQRPHSSAAAAVDQ